MISAYGMTADNFLRALPQVLQEDDRMRALAGSVAVALETLQGDYPLLRLYPAIDQMPEALLDLLAWDFKVDWWNPSWSLERKRQSLKASWQIHRILGTPKAVSLAIEAAFGSGYVEEWFQYDGQPHYFRIYGLSSEMTKTGYAVFRRLLAIVKRESSWLEKVVVVAEHDGHIYAGCGLALTRWSDVDCSVPQNLLVHLIDESGDILADEDGARFYDEEE